MERTFVDAYVGRECMKLLDTISHKVKPCITVHRNRSIIYVNHYFSFSHSKFNIHPNGAILMTASRSYICNTVNSLYATKLSYF